MPTDKNDSISVETKKFDHYNILIVPSSQFFNHALVVMLSAIQNCKLPCHFYILHCSWDDYLKEECIRFIDRYPENKVDFVEFSQSDFEGLIPWKGRLEPYAKMAAHLYLPQDVDRVLYLDCDLYVNKDIYEYYSMDFGSNYILASSETLSLSTFQQRKIDGFEKYGVINTGVTLFNISKLRKDNITIKTYINAAKKIKEYRFADQGLLSYVFADKIKILPSYKYNHLMFQEGTVNQIFTYKRIFATPFQERTKLFTEEYWNEEFDEEHDATIVHFTGNFVAKPWCVKIKIQEDGNINVVDVPYLEKTHLSRQVVDQFYIGWWNIAKNLPKLKFEQLMSEAESFVDDVRIKKLNSMQFVLNALDFCSELCCDIYGQKRFERYLKSLSEKNIAMLKQQDRVSKVFKAAADMYKAQIVFSSDKGMLSNLTEEELAQCQKADVVITCCVHGTKTHERDGVKCIDIWDILRDDSLTANLPEISDGADNIKIDGSISELHEDILKLSEHINEKFVKLSKVSDETLKEEIKTLHSEKDKLNEELGRLSSENKSLTERIAQITEEKSTLLENILSVSRDKEFLSADVSLLKEKIAQLEKEKSIADSELDKTKQELKNEQEASAASAQKAELLNNKILEMQSTRSWRYTRIFRKNKKDEEI